MKQKKKGRDEDVKIIPVHQNDQKEELRFEAFTKTGPKSHFCQSIEWGNIKAKTGWKPIRFMVEEDGEVRAAVSVLKRKLPGINRHILYVSRGPVVDFYNKEVMDVVIKELKALGKREKAVFIKFDPDIVIGEEIIKILKGYGFRPKGENNQNFEGVQPKFVFRLPIENQEKDTLLENMERKTRYNIRLAAKKGVTIREATREDLTTFYRILYVTAVRDRFGIRNENYFQWMWDEMVPKGIMKVFLAEYVGQVISGTLAFHYGDKVWYLYGASDNVYRNLMPNYLLQWHMIEWAVDLGAKVYDFRGVSGDLSPDNHLYGLYRFKKGFMGELTEFVGEYDLVLSPTLYLLYEKLVPAYKKMRRKKREKTRAKEAGNTKEPSDIS